MNSKNNSLTLRLDGTQEKDWLTIESIVTCELYKLVTKVRKLSEAEESELPDFHDTECHLFYVTVRFVLL